MTPLPSTASDLLPAAFVVVATKGRSKETAVLLDHIGRQTLRPRSIILVGAGAEDVAGLAGHPVSGGIDLIVRISPTAGLCAQRNYATSLIERPPGGFFVAYFDDDFRPRPDWLRAAAETFRDEADIVGLTGWVLADGINRSGIAEDEALLYLDGRLPPLPHWASGESRFETSSVYGCNMAFRDEVVNRCRFDERLVLYGWQEDRDFTGQAMRLGRVVYEPNCKGVHLGISSGRVSGRRLGYSQVANLVYLARKGTTDWKTTVRFISKNLASNIVRSFHSGRDVDYRGRLLGNVIALAHVAGRKISPEHAGKL